MRVRHFMPVLLLTAACALLAGTVNAQNVFVSPGGSTNNRTPQATTPTPPPVAATPTAPRNTTAGTVRQTTPTAPGATSPRTQARTAIDLPPERSQGQSAEIGLRHLGITPRPSAARRMLQSFTPEELERVRQRYENMGKRNPELAGYNPINTLELLERTRGIQYDLADRVNAACTSGSIRVLISQMTFNGKPEAEANLVKNGTAPLGAALADVCSDVTLRRQLSKGVFLITIFNAPGQAKPELFTGDGILTLSDDFSRAEGMPAGQMKTILRTVIAEAARTRSEGGTAPADGPDHAH